MSATACNVKQAVGRVERRTDLLKAHPAARTIAARALDVEFAMTDPNDSAMSAYRDHISDRRAFRSMLATGAPFIGLPAVGVGLILLLGTLEAGRFWPSLLVANAVLVAAVAVIAASCAFSSVESLDTEGRIAASDAAIAFARRAAESLERGCAEDAVLEAALAAGGDADRFAAICTEMEPAA